MPTTFVKGDIFEPADAPGAAKKPRALAFAADCSGSMDKGIAVAFKKRWPALEEAYRGRAMGGKMHPGDVFPWKEGDDVIYVLGMQQGDKKPRVSTLQKALETMIARAIEDGIDQIALPRIGAGKGGIDRVRVKKILTEAGDRSPVGLIVYEQFVRTKGDETEVKTGDS